jgi:hypothetical protein
MRTSFHHQSEAQHPKSSAIHNYVGRLPYLLGQFQTIDCPLENGPCEQPLIYSGGMCGRIIQSSGPLRLAIVEGLDVSDSRMANIRPRYNAGPSQELLVIRENHKSGECSLALIGWGLIPHWCQDPKGGRKPINAKAESLSRLPMLGEAYAQRRLHAHRFVGFVHVFHAFGIIACLHGRLGLIERRHCCLLLGGIFHLSDHLIHLLHMLVVAEIGGTGLA